MSWLRRHVRSFGRWLVDWADRGERIHWCRDPKPLEAGVSYEQTWSPLMGRSITAVSLRRGQTCFRCGEVNA